MHLLERSWSRAVLAGMWLCLCLALTRPAHTAGPDAPVDDDAPPSRVWANRSVIVDNLSAVPQMPELPLLYPLDQLPFNETSRQTYVPARFEDADAGDPGFDPTDPPLPEAAIIPIEPVDVMTPAVEADGFWQRFSEHFVEWTSRISLGARALTGNSRQNFIDFAADFEKKDGKRRFSQINLLGQYGESAEKVVANRWFANSTTDYYHGEKWMTFVKIMDQYDQLQNLDYRGTLSGGAGYRFFFEDHRRLVFRVGPGVTGEIFHSPSDNRVTPDLFSELEVRLPIWERLKWEQKTTVFPSLSALDVARATSQTAFLYAFDEKERWSLKLGLLYQYISQPNLGRLPSDFTTNLSIVYLRK